jgi:hypothetical protein
MFERIKWDCGGYLSRSPTAKESRRQLLQDAANPRRVSAARLRIEAAIISHVWANFSTVFPLHRFDVPALLPSFNLKCLISPTFLVSYEQFVDPIWEVA